MSDYHRERVAITRTGQGISRAVQEAISLAGGLPNVGGKKVVIKPNLVSPSPSGHGVTDSRVTAAVAEVALDAGASVVIAEGSAVGFLWPTDHFDTWEAFEVSGTAAEARRLGVDLVDLNRDAYEMVAVENPYALESVTVPRTILEADLVISVPVFKRHHFTGLTLACKNLQGTMPWRYKRLTHRAGLEGALSDISMVERPGFAVVDGNVATQSQGDESPLGLIVAGRNPTAVDATCGRIVGYEPDRMALLRFNAERGFGVIAEEQIEITGLRLADVSTHWRWSSLTYLDQYPQVNWILRDPMPCSACMQAAGVGLFHVTSVLGKESLQGLRLAVGGDPTGGSHAQVDLVIGDCAASWASGQCEVLGRTPNPAQVVARLCELRGLDVESVIEFRRSVPESDWEDIRFAAAHPKLKHWPMSVDWEASVPVGRQS